jgi:hypothetical protein
MILSKKLLLVALSCVSMLASAQDPESPPIQFRVVLQDPMNPSANLFFRDSAGVVVQIELRPKALSLPMVTKTVKGSLVLYDKATIDPEKPDASLAAICKIPVGAKRGIVIILPSPADTKPPYRMVFIDDSAKAFPKGESRILTLMPTELAMEAGEHKLPIHPGEIARLPAVRKVDEFNMAQTNFYFKKGDSWTVITQRQLQYLDRIRRIFIIHVTPGAVHPTVNSITDNTAL